MLKISRKVLLHRDRLRDKAWRKSLKRRFESKGVSLETVKLQPPKNFNLSESYEETVKFLTRLKDQMSDTSKGYNEKRILLDLGEIETMSLGGALVLAAEIDRWRFVRSVPLSTIGVSNLGKDVHNLLTELGFFELLGASKSDKKLGRAHPIEFRVLRITSGSLAEGEKIALIQEHLEKVAEIFEQDPMYYGAMFEAAHNSWDHAYPKGIEFKYQHVHRWWATASWNTENETIKLLVYDQGVGIAETLPRSQIWEQVKGLLGAVPYASLIVKDQASMIAAALEVARTSKGSGRGQGFRDIVAPIDQLGSGKLRILSGKGEILYTSGGSVVKTEKTMHVGGTLIEWTVPVGAV